MNSRIIGENDNGTETRRCTDDSFDPLAVKANETLRLKARIKDRKAVEIIQALKIDTTQYDK